MNWKPLWKEFTGEDFIEGDSKTITVEEGIQKYTQTVAFWNWEKTRRELPEEEVRKRLHAAIKRSSNLDEEVSGALGFSSGILYQILSGSKKLLEGIDPKNDGESSGDVPE